MQHTGRRVIYASGFDISTIKKDKRYIEYIDQISDADIEGRINMDATLDRLIAEGETRGEIRGAARSEARGEKKESLC